jgi:hypothetical protein
MNWTITHRKGLKKVAYKFSQNNGILSEIRTRDITEYKTRVREPVSFVTKLEEWLVMKYEYILVKEKYGKSSVSLCRNFPHEL